MAFSFPLIAVLCRGNKPPSYLLTPPLLPVLETIDHSVAILWTLHPQTAEQKKKLKGRKEEGVHALGRGRGGAALGRGWGVGFGRVSWGVGGGKQRIFQVLACGGAARGEDWEARSTGWGKPAVSSGAGTCQICPFRG